MRDTPLQMDYDHETGDDDSVVRCQRRGLRPRVPESADEALTGGVGMRNLISSSVTRMEETVYGTQRSKAGGRPGSPTKS